MDGVAATKAQADSELKMLRRDRGVSGQELRDSALVSSLDQALNILSDQLSQTPTHFLFELIQNADDNSYASGVTPSLRLLLYEKGGHKYLRTDCNEVGFTFNQINALALIGQSTKKSSTRGQKGYIGEKGIGFKSVFKVADVVNVASGFYEFKFDRNKPIGMMLPILAPFPRAGRVPNHTQFLLQLKSEDYYDEVLGDLEGIEPQLLMFLRRLKKLHISTPATNKTYRILTDEFNDDFGGETVTISERDEDRGSVKKMKYIVQRYDVRNLPPDSQREGITTSEAMLAFPIRDRITPRVKRQKAFAFLPIDDFGFRFLIHADFLLVASREGLEYKLPWNRALRTGLRKAFLKAIGRFISMPADESGKGLCYTWPEYIPRQSGSSRFWNRLHEDILDDLCDEQILRSRDEDAGFRKPGALRYVPAEFRFGDGTLFDLTSIRKSHLAFNYDDVEDQLALIGVERLTISDLCKEFRKWTTEVGVAGIQAQSMAWHRQVAFLFQNEWQLKESLMNLPIIPLRDGSWVNARTDHVYLASEKEDEHLPSGVDISIVDQTASQDSTRRRFFQFLGIKKYTPEQVCDLILELHVDGSPRLSDRADEDLVTDAAYLFKHRSLLSGSGAPEIFFVVKKDGELLRRKSRMYIIDPTAKPGLVAKYRDTPGNPFPVLDDRYETVICRGEEKTTRVFHKWLVRSANSCFTAVPTLVRNAKLTVEWAFLCNTDVTDLLLVVKFHWENHPRPPKLLKAVPELKVRCLDGITRPLGLLAIPTKELLRECPHLDFADLPNPTWENWSFLSEFGVLTTGNTTARLRELQALSNLPLDEFDKEAVHRVYRALSSSSSLDREEIQETFRKNSLVFITQPNPKWIRHSICVWTAPAPLKQVIRLKSRYKDCKTLFCDFLGVEPASIRYVADEFCSLSNGRCENPVQRCEELLSLLNSFLTKGSRLDDREVRSIATARAFPVLEASDASQAEPNIVSRSLDGGGWYIPDRTTLESAFRGKVDLLNLSVKSVRSLNCVFKELDCEDMVLSSAVEETAEPRGPSIRDMLKEQDLKTRLKYISYLAAPGDVKPMKDLLLIHVWSVPSITIKRRLDGIEVDEDNELITVQENQNITDIYFREKILECQQPMVNFKLAEYFSSQFEIKFEDANFLTLLLSAPMSQLPAIMEDYNGFLSDEHDNGESGSEATTGEEGPTPVERSEDRRGDEDGIELGRSDEEERRDDQLDVASESTDRQAECESPSVFTHASTQYPQSLRELVPSHKSRTESVVRRANHFRMSDSLVARTPTQPRRTGGGFRHSLPIRTGNNHYGYDYRSSAGQETSAASFPGNHRHRNISDPFVGSAGGDISPPSSPVRSPARAGARPVPVREVRHREIGFQGEDFIYNLFLRHIDDWTFENWTSKLRVEDGHPRFTERERDFTDFTYPDRSGHMKELLREAHVELNAEWSNSTTYHLEVKTTIGRCSEPFFVSQNQVDMMRYFHDDPDNAYILLRVFNINIEGEGPGLKIFPNPWSLYTAGVLDFRSAEGYQVYEKDESEETSFQINIEEN